MDSLESAVEDVDKLRELLESGASPNSKLEHLQQPLIVWAAQHNKTEAVQLLVQFGAELESVTIDGDTAVDFAVDGNAVEALKALLVLGANPNGGGKREESPLHIAAGRMHDARCTQLLLQYGANCNQRDQHGDMPVHRACLNESVINADAVLKHWPQSANAIGARGFTPLHIAANLANSNLFITILSYSPKFDINDRQDRTALDIVLAKQDSFIIEAMARKMISRVIQGGITTITELLERKEGQEFLKTLHTIDNEFQHRCGNHSGEYCAGSSLIVHLKQPEKFDISEYVELLTKACNEGLAEEIANDDTAIAGIANYILKHVLLTQNETFLQDLLKLGVVWSAIVLELESRIIDVYNSSVSERRDGIKGLIFRNCMLPDGSVSSHRLHKLVASLTKLWQLQLDDNEDEEEHHNEVSTEISRVKSGSKLEAMKDPVESLAVWSVLTGRLRLAPHFLRQEDFDLIPQALLLAKILRSLGRRRDIEDVYADKASKMASTCEGMAMQAMRRIKEVDTSQNNMLTMELILLPLETFGEYTILDLAAKGESSSFVTIDIVQESLDRLWYSDFFFVRKGLLMELVILCGFLPPLQLIVPSMLRKFRALTPDFLELGKLDKANNNSDGDNTALIEDQSANAASANDKPTDKLLVKFQSRDKANDSDNNSTFLEEMRNFYQIPCVKFRIHVAMHITFVIMLSYIVVKDFGKSITPPEVICYLCLLGFLVEEINEIITASVEETVTDYFKDGWNLIDLVAIFFGFLAFILRFNNDVLIRYWSLVLLTTTCLAYWVRLLFVSVVLESLGPKLKMMSLMVKKDFLPFLYILFVLMFGFGVTFQALLYPEGKPPHDKAKPLTGGAIFLQMFRNTFYAIVGDYGLDSITNACDFSDILGNKINGTDGDNSESSCKHPIGAILVPDVFMVLYIVIMQILLLNVIVAMFSKTIDAINNESKAMWQFEKYDLVEEFNTRSALPPPFNTLSELRNLISYLIKKIRGSPEHHEHHVTYDSEAQHQVKVYLCSLYYQALAYRNQRVGFNGVVLDEEDLDEGNKIIYSQVNDIREKMERLDKLDDTVQKLEKLVKELKALSIRGPSNINAKRRSVMSMQFADD